MKKIPTRGAMFILSSLMIAGCATVEKIDHSETVTASKYFIRHSPWSGAKGTSILAVKVFKNGDKFALCGATMADHVGSRLHDSLMNGMNVSLGNKRLMSGLGKLPRYSGKTLVGKRAECFATEVDYYKGYKKDKLRIKASRTTFYE